jgi:hypothetical protein
VFGVFGGKECVGYIQNGEGILMNKVYGLGVRVEVWVAADLYSTM